MANDEDCVENDGKFEVSIGIEFEMVTDEDGDLVPRAAAVRTHVHNVPLEAATRTLVMVAQKMLSDHMAHTLFEGCPSHELAHAMARAAATAYLTDAIKNTPFGGDVVSTIIPDDISELFGD